MDDLKKKRPPLEPPQDNAWELNLGIKWFSRAGIVALLIGFAMALNYSFPQFFLMPEVKLLIGGLVAAGLFLAGNKLLDSFQLLGRILQGGGFALGYLSLFGMFFIPAVQLFAEPHLQSMGWGLLLLYVGGMLTFSQRIGSRSIALLSLAFGYYTASYSGTQLPALLSATLLSIASIVASHRPGWQHVSLVGLLGGLFTGLYWHWFGGLGEPINIMPTALIGDKPDELYFLAVHYLLFHLGSFQRGQLGQGMAVLNSLFSYSVFLLIGGAETLGIKGLAEGLMALTHLASFAWMSRTENTGTAKSELLLTTFFAFLATMGLLGAEIKPIAFAAQALLLGMMNRGGLFQKLYLVLALLFLGLAFLSLCFFDWGVVSALSLVGIVGSVTVAALVLEGTLFKPEESLYRIFLMLISAFVFLASLMIGLESYWITLGIVLTGFTLLMSGFVITQARYRWMGLCWIFLAAFRLFTVDLATLPTEHKIILFLALGVTLLAGSYGYNHLNQQLKQSRQHFLPADQTQEEIY